MTPKRVVAVLGLVIPLVGLPVLTAAEKPNQPPYFAIQNARLVSGTGQVIEKGTIILAKGLITEMGAQATIPPEAWVIDGEGLTVYPGLIDAMGDLGLKDAPSGPPGAGPGAGGPPQRSRNQAVSRGPEDRPGTTSWKKAADELKTADKRLESWRNGGFTSAVSTPMEGILPGQAAFINLAGERPREMVIETPVALTIRLEGVGGRSFPGSLMGVFAYVKQIFLDADHYGAAWSVYEANPLGLERPTYDRSLEPLVQAKAEKWPVLIPGHWTKEIARAVRLGKQLGVSTVVYGGHQGHGSAELLKDENVPILVSVKWPEKSEDGDPEEDVPLRTLRFWDQAPSTPAALQKAGVRFAFYSDGLKDPKEIFDNVRKAIEAGLSKEAVLTALTVGPAEIFGVADRLGSLEKGKIANLVVTDGDLFDEETKVKMVFIDGRKYNIRETEMPESGRPSTRWE
jgi:imidazolonepropionase-like amidohydrolase